MKLYRAEWDDPDDGTIVSWHASKREAKSAVSDAIKNGNAQEPTSVKAVNVPTKKGELIAWLNLWVNRDNG